MKTWKRKASHVRIAQIGTDFCHTCCIIMRSREEDKWNLLKHHQTKAIVEKSMHSEIITQTDQSRHRMHFAFDFAQAISIPHEHMEPKDEVDLFGVTWEGNTLSSFFQRDLFQAKVPTTSPKGEDIIC